MSLMVYKELLEVMQKRGGGYAGLDVPEFFEMVEEMFTPDQAEVNNAMPRGPFTAETMAETLEKGQETVEEILESMANQGLCLAFKSDGVQYYSSARFMPGILEFQFMPGKSTDRDRKIAKLIHAYELVFDTNVPVQENSFPTTRVITVDKTVETGNKIHTYDQVQTYIDNNDIIAVSECYCRHAAQLRGEESHDLPNDVCMQLGMGAQFAIERLGARQLSKKEAREVLEKSEEAGLIHMSQNTAEEIGFICNCDRWDCVSVTGTLKYEKPGLHFNSGFDPLISAEECTACETCIDRCPPEAMVLGDNDVPVINFDRCFGCAVCATGCPSEAITMVNKPEFKAPPLNAKAMKDAIKASMPNN